MKLANLDTEYYLKLLVYGDSGSGKTTLIGSAMEHETTFPLLVLDAGGQPISLRRLDPRPLVLTIDAMKDFNLVYEFFQRGQDFRWLKERNRDFQELLYSYLESVGADRFGSLAIDSITHVQRIAMTEIVGSGNLGPGDVPPQTQIQQWGRVLAQMTYLADKYFKLDAHVLMTALTRRDNIESMGLTLFCPFLWGQSSLEIPSHAEMVGRLMSTATIPVKTQKDITQAAGKAGAKTPFNILYLRGGRDYIAKWQGVSDPPPLVPSPTISKLMSIAYSERRR